MLALVLLSGCGGDPVPIGPQGVDGLEVPTPSPDAADFVRRVDNPYLPLAAGYEWAYRLDGGRGASALVTVTEGTRTVAGVRTTVVHEVVRSRRDRVVSDTYAWFAQDRAGNVWAFGENTEGRGSGGSWEAGVDGAEAALAMPATPRVGDGYQLEHAVGVAEDQARVVAVDERREVAGTTYGDLVVTEVTTPLEPGLVRRRYHAPGTGLVHEETISTGISGGGERVELVRSRLVASDA